MRAALIAAVLVLVPAASASAATAGLQRSGCGTDRSGAPFDCRLDVAVVAKAGEVNRVTIDQRDGRILAMDAGAPLRAGEGCAQVDDHSVSCPAVAGVILTLGDGDDEAQVRGPGHATGIVAAGGDGNDRLGGGPGRDVLLGGPGDDQLAGGTGYDELRGEAGADVLDGGGDVDSATYPGEEPVRVDLADPAPDGPTSGQDTLRGIENAAGGSGDDTLRGDAGPNVLSGGDGNDVLEGRDGDDELAGGFGFDRLRAGAGDDQLVVAPDLEPERGFRLDPDREEADCGPGRDLVAEQRGDVLRGCELVELFGRSLGPRARVAPVALTTRRAVFRFPCAGDRRRVCRAFLRLERPGGTAIGRGRVRWRRGEPVRLALRPGFGGPGRFALRVTLRYADDPRDVLADEDYDTLTYVTAARVRRPG